LISMTPDFAYVNERLAKHAGIPNVFGSYLRVAWGDRGGPARQRRRADGHRTP
jgi:hypothetical protein